jgi:hypothetical protein
MAFNTKISLDNGKVIQPDGCQLTLSGDTKIDAVGTIQYTTDQSGSYVARSLVDAAYVTGKTNCSSAISLKAITGVTNGLTKIDCHNACLGGNVTTSLSVTPVAAATITVGTATNRILETTGCTNIQNQTGNEVDGITVNATQVGLYTMDAVASKFAYQTFCGTDPSLCTAVLNAGCAVAMCQTPNGLVITGCLGTFPGAQYAADYRAQFTDNSLITKKYVCSQTSGVTSNAICTANNGLTKVGQNVVLGGALTGATTLTAVNGTSLLFTDSRTAPIGIQYGGDYSAAYQARTLVDAAYVTGKTHNMTTIGSQGQIIYRDATKLTGCTNMIYCDAQKSFAFGVSNVASGANSGVFGGENSTACGADVGIFGGEANVASAPCSAILGGTDNIICNTSLRSVIIGSQNIHLSGATFNDTVAVDCLAIMDAKGCTCNLLCVNTTTGKVGYTSVSAFGGLTGATNGLGLSGQKVCLGGVLIADTSICGAGTYDLCLGTDASKLDCLCTVAKVTCIKGGSLSIASSGATFTDLSPFGTLPSGIIYGADYSNCFCNNSLVTKKYVDTVATGLIVKASVKYATTGAITLTGNQTIDGYMTVTGDRVLVKNQASGATNGIYSASTGAWTRATDFNGVGVTGEVSNGNLIPVTSGDTQNSSIWVLTTPNPITVGTTALSFSEFSTVIDVQGGPGIAITQVGGVHTVCVELGNCSSAGCGLAVTAGGLCVNSTIAGSGLTYNSGVLKVNAASGGAGSAISVKVNAGNCLVINCADVVTCVNSITGATNGLTETNHVVCLGGLLTQDTTVCGNNSHSLSLCGLCTFNLGFGQGDTQGFVTDACTLPRGLQYAGDYSASFCNNSLVSKYFVNNAITGSTLTFCNGLTKSGSKVCLGGTLTTGSTVVGINTNGSTMFEIGNGTTRYTGGNLVLNSDAITTANNYSWIGANDYHAGVCCSSVCVNAATGIALCATVGTCVHNVSLGNNALLYAGNYCADFIARSIPDVAWVNSQITGGTGISNANNGLTKKGNTVVLGGELTGTTYINTNGFGFFVTGNTASHADLIIDSGGIGIGDYYCGSHHYISVDGMSTYLVQNTTDYNCVSEIVLNCSGDISLRQCKLFDADNGCCSRIYLANGAVELYSIFNKTGNTIVDVCLYHGSGMTISSDSPSFGGAKYCADYSANYTCLSIPNAGWVTGKTTTAGNGLTKEGNKVILGGALTGQTTINGAQILRINVTQVDITGTTAIVLSGTTYIGLPASGVPLVDDVLVRVAGTGEIRTVSGAALGDKNNIYATTAVTTSVALNTGSSYVVLANAGSAITITLPGTPKNGQAFKIKDASGNALTNNITVSGGGHNIDGSASGLINTDFGALELVYNTALTAWFSLAFIN